MTSEMKVKAAHSGAVFITKPMVGVWPTSNALDSEFLGRDWDSAALHESVQKFWNAEGLKIACPSPHLHTHNFGSMGNYCYPDQSCCFARIALAQERWMESQKAALQFEPCIHCGNSISIGTNGEWVHEDSDQRCCERAEAAKPPVEDGFPPSETLECGCVDQCHGHAIPPAQFAPKDIFEAVAVIAELRETISTLQRQLDDARERYVRFSRSCDFNGHQEQVATLQRQLEEAQTERDNLKHDIKLITTALKLAMESDEPAEEFLRLLKDPTAVVAALKAGE